VLTTNSGCDAAVDVGRSDHVDSRARRFASGPGEFTASPAGGQVTGAECRRRAECLAHESGVEEFGLPFRATEPSMWTVTADQTGTARSITA
jgi:hypothetical protein